MESTGKQMMSALQNKGFAFPQFRSFLWGIIMWYLQMQQSRPFTPNLLLLSWRKIEVICGEKGFCPKKDLVLHQKFSHWLACRKRASTHSHYEEDIVERFSWLSHQVVNTITDTIYLCFKMDESQYMTLHIQMFK